MKCLKSKVALTFGHIVYKHISAFLYISESYEIIYNLFQLLLIDRFECLSWEENDKL